MVEVVCKAGFLNLTDVTAKLKTLGLDFVQSIEEPFLVEVTRDVLRKLGQTVFEQTDSYYFFISDKVGMIVEFTKGCSWGPINMQPDLLMHFLNLLTGKAT